MRGGGFLGGCTIERLAHLWTVRQLITESCPHLQYCIRESELEYGPCDSPVSGLIRHIQHMPGLLAARCIRQPGQLFGLLSAEASGELCSVDVDEPCVAVPRRDAFGGKHHRKYLAVGT